tara:strand:- start:5926 stop:7914 length:1989 start_codon:yes stop_codon:yes gene_type:complete
MFISPFENEKKSSKIDPEADIIFVADMFVEDYVGGAELTTEALIEASGDLKVQKLRASEINMAILEQGFEKFWVFGNFSSLQPSLIPTIISNINYAVLEYDYKFCHYRSIEKHAFETGDECDCHNEIHGKMISAFFHGAKCVWYMSEQQQKRYHDRFPFLDTPHSIVLSSVFDENFFQSVKKFNEGIDPDEKEGWIVLGSDSWIKGADDAVQYCEKNNLEYEVVWGLDHGLLLAKLAAAKGFVYLPRGGDTCPRMVIEAKALGCEVVLNDNVQHKDEDWFTGSQLDMMSYLYAARDRFWLAIKSYMNYSPTVSGYTTVLNANRMGYPWLACVNSLLGFCDEVVVVDAGSDDGTWEDLQEMASIDERLKVHQKDIPKDHPSFAYETDGKLKAHARSFCTSDFCWQMDADEVVHEDDYKKVHHIMRSFPKYIDIVSLPVVEYWGSARKVRMDINPWKWRLSRNLPHITQGIPTDLLKVDNDGNEYAGFGTDSCDYIHSETGERLEHVGFYTQEVHQVRIQALQGNKEAKDAYESWFANVIDQLPGVHHYSWFNIPNKIRQYKQHWGTFWKSLYRQDSEDTAENNVMFDKPWADVTEEDIDALGGKLASKLGGWIFHNKVSFDNPTPHLTINRSHPEEWVKNPTKDISPLGCSICIAAGDSEHNH